MNIACIKFRQVWFSLYTSIQTCLFACQPGKASFTACLPKDLFSVVDLSKTWEPHRRIEALSLLNCLACLSLFETGQTHLGEFMNAYDNLRIYQVENQGSYPHPPIDFPMTPFHGLTPPIFSLQSERSQNRSHGSCSSNQCMSECANSGTLHASRGWVTVADRWCQNVSNMSSFFIGFQVVMVPWYTMVHMGYPLASSSRHG